MLIFVFLACFVKYISDVMYLCADLRIVRLTCQMQWAGRLAAEEGQSAQPGPAGEKPWGSAGVLLLGACHWCIVSHSCHLPLQLVVGFLVQIADSSEEVVFTTDLPMPAAGRPTAIAVGLVRVIQELASIAIREAQASEEQPEPEVVPAGEEEEEQTPDKRHYCVWHCPCPTLGRGIYSGTFPQVWNAILAQGKNGDQHTSLAGSAITLKSYNTLEEATSHWTKDCPKKWKAVIKNPPQTFLFH